MQMAVFLRSNGPGARMPGFQLVEDFPGQSQVGNLNFKIRITRRSHFPLCPDVRPDYDADPCREDYFPFRYACLR